MTGLRVLLLDNDPDQLRLTTEMLVADGCTVYACSTCEHAARLAPLMRPRAFLLHGFDGDEAGIISRLHAASPHTPLIYFLRDLSEYAVHAAHRSTSGYKTFGAAIRAALIQKIEAV